MVVSLPLYYRVCSIYVRSGLLLSFNALNADMYEYDNMPKRANSSHPDRYYVHTRIGRLHSISSLPGLDLG